jgi:hypothetical protein
MTLPGTAIIFFLGSSSGGIDINLTLNGTSYLWEFFSANQLFSGSISNPVLLTGTFPYGTGDFSFNNGAGFLFSPQNGTIVASSPVTSVPEPGSLTLLGTGIVAFAGAVRRKLLSRLQA